MASAACSAPAASVSSPPPPSVSSVPSAAAGLVWELTNGISQPTRLAIAAGGDVYVVGFGDDRIHHLDVTGHEDGSWGGSGSAAGELDKAAGIAVAPDGSVYVADHDNYRIQKFTADGRFVLQWGSKGDKPGQLFGPDGVAVAPNGQIYVTEDENARVQVFTPDGRFVRSWKGPQGAPFGDPTGITFVGDDVVVADYNESTLSVFDGTGKRLRTFGKPGSRDGEFAGISLITADAAGHIFATDYNNGRIQEFDASGRFVAKFLTPEGERFRRPYGIGVTREGDLVVAEFLGGRVLRFTPRPN